MYCTVYEVIQFKSCWIHWLRGIEGKYSFLPPKIIFLKSLHVVSIMSHFIFLCFYRSILLTKASLCMQIPKWQLWHAVWQGWRVVKLVIASVFHSSIVVSVELIAMKIEDPGSSAKAVKSRCKLLLSPSLIALYFSSCHRPEAFNSLKLAFIIIMQILHFNSSMVFNWFLDILIFWLIPILQILCSLTSSSSNEWAKTCFPGILK